MVISAKGLAEYQDLPGWMAFVLIESRCEADCVVQTGTRHFTL